MSSPTVVSAPGKVLLAGGYLVLDRAHAAFVFGLSARIAVAAMPIEPAVAGVQLSEIVVESPQFVGAQWRYGYRLADAGGGIRVTQLQAGPPVAPNPFVETTLAYALSYIAHTAHRSARHALTAARLVVLADTAYYSHAAPAAGARFARFPTAITDTHKTGLGSSAALVTALAAALLAHYLPRAACDLATPAGRWTLHNLAQAAHCAAQGKVGSGFDVAAAVWGSCRYRRFSPAVLARVPPAGEAGFAAALARLVDEHSEGQKELQREQGIEEVAWDVEIDPAGVRLPHGLALRMCDVDCGSQTVGMVKQVLAWRATQGAAAAALWATLHAANEHLAALLREREAVEAAGDEPYLAALAAAVRAVRAANRAMGEASGVPIEPPAQTQLLDALAAVPGVVGGVVPGAGGFDALALVMRADAATEAGVREVLARWSESRGKVRLLDVVGEMDGVRYEEAQILDGWV